LLTTHEELVATHASERVLGTDSPAQSFGYFDQDRITCEVAEGVVDTVEVVQTTRQHRHGRWRADAPLEGVLEAIAKLHAVRKTGEIIVERLVADHLFGFIASLLDELLGRDVPNQQADPFAKAARSCNRREAPFEPSCPCRNLQTKVADLGNARCEDVADDADHAEPQLVA
jgi:hypothetical protein